jgi:hypothetical protein
MPGEGAEGDGSDSRQTVQNSLVAQPHGGAHGDKNKTGMTRRLLNTVRQIISVPLLFGIAAPALAAMVIFSEIDVFGLKIGIGGQVITLLHDHYVLSDRVLGVAVMSSLVLYILDVSYWPQSLKLLKRAVFGFVSFCFVAGACLAAKSNPTAPISLYLLSYPIWSYMVKNLLYSDLPEGTYLAAIAFILGAVGITNIVLFLKWMIIDQNWWTPELEVSYRGKVGCEIFNATVVNATGDTAKNPGCLAAYLLWISPMMFGVATILFATVCFFLSRMLTRAFQEGVQNHRLNTMMRFFATTLCVLLIAVWVAASVAGASNNLSSAVISFASISIVILGMIVSQTLGTHTLSAAAMKVPLIAKFSKLASSDWIKACFLYLSPLFIFYLALSWVNQRVRRMRVRRWFQSMEERDAFWAMTSPAIKAVLAAGNPGARERILKEQRQKQKKAAEEHRVEKEVGKIARVDTQFTNPGQKFGTRFTMRAAEQLQGVKSWNWTSVLSKVYYIGLFYMIFSLGIGKAVNLFLSWLTAKLDAVPFVVTVAIFISVGWFMFMLPPVPGVPVYLFGGVVVTGAGEKVLGGFWASLGFCCCVCFGIKLLAIASQQKCIGARYSNNTTVKQFVGVNSLMIQAIKATLLKPGLSLGKVAILCGGPDWPTSVLTGILDLRLSEMLLGSVPVMILIVPCCAAGAFLTKVSEGPSWASMSSATLALAGICQSTAGIVALYFVEDMSNSEQLRESEKTRVPDKAVLLLDQKIEQDRALFLSKTHWHRAQPPLPPLPRFFLIVTAAAMVVCVVLANAFSSECFEEFAVHDTIEAKLGGDWTNLIKPLGMKVLQLLAVSTIFLKFFNWWYSCIGNKTGKYDVEAEMTEVDVSADRLPMCSSQRRVSTNPVHSGMEATTGFEVAVTDGEPNDRTLEVGFDAI